MIDDLLKSTKDTIAERLASPLLGSFAVAWCLWNYKFLVILFSAASVPQTFQLIENLAFPDAGAVALRGILLPLATALIYVFAYPYPSRIVYAFTLRRQREVNAIRKQIEEETPLTLEESRAIRAEYVELDRQHQEAVDRLNTEIARLKAALDRTEKSALEHTILKPEERLYGVLEPSQLSLLKELAQKGGSATQEALLASSKGPQIRTEFDLGELQRRSLISRDYDQNSSDYTYAFTHEGRRVLLNDGKLGTS